MKPREHARPPFTIVVGLDFADGGDFAFRRAARIVHGVPGCHLHIVHLFEVEARMATKLVRATGTLD